MQCVQLSFRPVQIWISQAEQSFQTLCILCQMKIGEQRLQSRGTAVLGNGGPLRHIGVYRIACTAIDGLLLLRQMRENPLHSIALRGGGYVGKRGFAGVWCVIQHQLTANHDLQHRVTKIGKLGGGIGVRALIIMCIHIHILSIASKMTFFKTGAKKDRFSFGASHGVFLDSVWNVCYNNPVNGEGARLPPFAVY